MPNHKRRSSAAAVLRALDEQRDVQRLLAKLTHTCSCLRSRRDVALRHLAVAQSELREYSDAELDCKEAMHEIEAGQQSLHDQLARIRAMSIAEMSPLVDDVQGKIEELQDDFDAELELLNEVKEMKLSIQKNVDNWTSVAKKLETSLSTLRKIHAQLLARDSRPAATRLEGPLALLLARIAASRARQKKPTRS